MVEETFHDYLAAVAAEKSSYPSLRMGQCYFNLLSNIAPHITEDIRLGELDPFYDDGKIAQFLSYVYVAVDWREP